MNSEKAQNRACKPLKSLCVILLVALFIISSVLRAGYCLGLSAEVARPSEETGEAIEEMHAKRTPRESTHEYISLGEYVITAYCPCSECSEEWGNMTATGVRAKENHTIAVDPSVIPYGSVLLIDDIVYIAEDCGGAIKGKKLDIYFDTHAEACEYGRQTAEVFIKKEC